MKSTPTEHQQRRFRMRLFGFDTKEVLSYCRQLGEDIQRLKQESTAMRRELQEQERELREFRERDQSIRAILLNAQSTADQMRANAEKEARLVVAEAELAAEKILQGAHQRLAKLHEDIGELKRHRVQLETKLRSTIDTYQQLLNLYKEEEAEAVDSSPLPRG